MAAAGGGGGQHRCRAHRSTSGRHIGDKLSRSLPTATSTRPDELRQRRHTPATRLQDAALSTGRCQSHPRHAASALPSFGSGVIRVAAARSACRRRGCLAQAFALGRPRLPPGSPGEPPPRVRSGAERRLAGPLPDEAVTDRETGAEGAGRRAGCPRAALRAMRIRPVARVAEWFAERPGPPEGANPRPKNPHAQGSPRAPCASSRARLPPNLPATAPQHPAAVRHRYVNRRCLLRLPSGRCGAPQAGPRPPERAPPSSGPLRRPSSETRLPSVGSALPPAS